MNRVQNIVSCYKCSMLSNLGCLEKISDLTEAALLKMSRSGPEWIRDGPRRANVVRTSGSISSIAVNRGKFWKDFTQ